MVGKENYEPVSESKVGSNSKGQNWHADSLATLASSLTKEVPRLIKVEVVAEPSIDAKINASVVTVSEPCWMNPIIDFLAEDRLPADGKEANRVQMAAQY